MKKTIKTTLAWGGFSMGSLDWVDADYGWGGVGSGGNVMLPAVFKTRKIARERYEDVRRVEIREVKKP